MADTSLTYRLFGQDVSASKALDGVGKSADKAGKDIERGTSKGGAALSKLGSAAGTVAAGGILALGAAITQGVKDAASYQQLADKTAAVLKSTGNAAGTTVPHVQELAGSLESLSGADEELIINSQNVLATFCLEESAQALARGRGWVSHDELATGDEILAYDPDRDEAYWERIDSMHRFRIKGDLIRWRSRHIDVATTPHHRWWTVGNSGPQAYEPRFRTTEDISGRQVYVQIGGGAPAGFAGEAARSDDLVDLAGWVFTEGWFPKWRPQSRPRRERSCAACHERPARNTNGVARCDECALGPIQKGADHDPVTAETARHYAVAFCQSETANPLKVKRIRAMVERLRASGHRISETSRIAKRNGSTVVTWHFAGDLGRTIREMLPGKKLTHALIESFTADQAAGFLDVLIAADGSVRGNGSRVFIQKDRGQLDIVAALAAMLGQRTATTKRADLLTFQDTNRILGSAMHAEPEAYEGVVWCPHLRTGIFLARANGKTFWTGNTGIQNKAGANNDIFDQATKAALNLSTAMGSDLQSATVQVGKALNDPVKGMSALSKVGVSFTKEQKAMNKALVEGGEANALVALGFADSTAVVNQQVKAYEKQGKSVTDLVATYKKDMTPAQQKLYDHLVKGGNAMEAQKVILGELNKEFGGAAEAAGKGFSGSMARAQDAIGDAFRAVGVLLLPSLTKFADWVATKGVPMLVEFSHKLDPWMPVIKSVANVLGVVLVGALKVLWTVLTTVVFPAIGFLGKIFVETVGVILNGAAKAFGWVPGIGPKLQKAANDFNGFRDQVNRALAGIKDKDVNIYIHQQVLKTAGGQSVYSGAGNVRESRVQLRADGGPVVQGHPYIVGEQGMELFVPKANGFVVPNDRLLGASRPGSVALGGGPSITIQITQPLGTPEAIARAVRDALARSSSRGYGLGIA